MSTKILLIAFLVLFTAASGRAASEQSECRNLNNFDAIGDFVTKNFYDRTFRGLDWKGTVRNFRLKIRCQMTDEEVTDVVNQLLAQLHASHTALYTSNDQYYWALGSIFSLKINGAAFPQVGAWFKKIGGHWFTQDIFEGSIAERSGLKVGDEVISIDGNTFTPIGLFEEKNQILTVRRHKNEAPQSLVIHPKNLGYQDVMLEGTKLSEKIFHTRGKKIGYIHLWCGTHSDFLAALHASIERLSKTTDGLILDIRDGFGGAGPAYIGPLFPPHSEYNSEDWSYNKPVVALINSGTRSGKEWLAYILKVQKRATLVGEATAGAFLSGGVHKFDNDKFLLYLAMQAFNPPDVTSPIEGVGVSPDVRIADPGPYADGDDQQLKAAIKVLTFKILF